MQRFALTPSTRPRSLSARLRASLCATDSRKDSRKAASGCPGHNKMDPAKWTPSLNQRDELDRAMKTAGVLREWAALKRQGIIDDAEFQAMKARLLGRPPPPVEQVSDDEEKIGWSVNNDDEDAQRWASRNVAFAPKRPLLQPLEQRPLRSKGHVCLLYTSPSPRDRSLSRMPSSA